MSARLGMIKAETAVCLICLQIMKADVDYPKRNKKRALKDIALYPPRIELQISKRKKNASNLRFPLKVQGTTEEFALNISLVSSPSVTARSDDSEASSPIAESISTSSGLDSSSGSSENISSNSAESIHSSVPTSESPLSAQESSGYSSQDSCKGCMIQSQCNLKFNLPFAASQRPYIGKLKMIECSK